jgi:hypothetical protein
LHVSSPTPLFPPVTTAILNYTYRRDKGSSKFSAKGGRKGERRSDRTSCSTDLRRPPAPYFPSGSPRLVEDGCVSSGLCRLGVGEDDSSSTFPLFWRKSFCDGPGK